MEYRKLSELNKLEGNPRIIRDARFMDLCASLKKNPKFLEARPLILSDRTGKLVVIAGNQKFEAAKACKLKKVPTFLMSGLTEELEREIIVRDNAHAGDWDYDVLAEAWSDLPLADWGVPMPDGGGNKGEGGEEIALAEVDVSEVQDRFWMSVTGPLPKQKQAIEKLVASLESLGGVEVQIGSTAVDGEASWR